MFVLQVAMVKGRGGIATAVAHYERMFRAVGVRSAALFRGPSAAALRAEGVDMIDAPEFLTSPLAGALPVLGELRAAALERAAGEEIVVIAHSDRTLPALKRLFPNARVVTPCHSDKFKHKARADLVATLNQAQHDLARAALPGVRCALLGNPYVAAAATPPTGEGGLRLNFVARFIPTKDPLILLEAAALLQVPAKPQVRFIGAGELEGNLRAQASTLDADVSFPGWLSAPFQAFHRNDILVLPSHWEGLPYLLQEALDHGIPIVASDNPGNRAALADGDYGALFATGDAAALARALDEALADIDALRARSEKGRATLHARCGAAPFWASMRRALGERENA